jgi:hypothetical protein
MYQYHPEVAQALSRERQARALDLADRERRLAASAAPRPGRSPRWLAVALVTLAPVVVVMMWVLIVR